MSTQQQWAVDVHDHTPDTVTVEAAADHLAEILEHDVPVMSPEMIEMLVSEIENAASDACVSPAGVAAILDIARRDLAQPRRADR